MKLLSFMPIIILIHFIYFYGISIVTPYSTNIKEHEMISTPILAVMVPLTLGFLAELARQEAKKQLL